MPGGQQFTDHVGRGIRTLVASPIVATRPPDSARRNARLVHQGSDSRSVSRLLMTRASRSESNGQSSSLADMELHPPGESPLDVPSRAIRRTFRRAHRYGHGHARFPHRLSQHQVVNDIGPARSGQRSRPTPIPHDGQYPNAAHGRALDWFVGSSARVRDEAMSSNDQPRPADKDQPAEGGDVPESRPGADKASTAPAPRAGSTRSDDAERPGTEDPS